MSGGTPYIGSTISLVSKAEIRYEGILWSIDTKDSTVTLANVRSYGTEDRATEKQVGPRSEVYEYIVFRGSDIKDLHVSKAPKPINTVNQDPSILQQGAVGSGFSHFPNTTPYAAPGYGNYAHPYGYGNQPSTYSPVPQPGINPGRAGSPLGVPLIQSRTPSPPVNVTPIGSVSQTKTLESETQTPQPPSQKSTQTGKPRRRSGSRRNSTETNQNGPSKPTDRKEENEEAPTNQKPNENKTRGPAGGSQQQPGNTRKGKPVKFNGEFDFESSNARFDKDKIESELKSEIEKMKISAQDEEVIVENEVEVESPGSDGVYYDKAKSFFDFISSDPLPSEQGKRSGSWQEERKLNVETFGVSGSYTRGYGRGRGWRGRCRGRGRGRGRGGFRGNNYRDGGNNYRDGGNRDDGDRNQQNRTNNRGGRGGYRGYRGNRGMWRNNTNKSQNEERIKTEPTETS